MIARDRPEGSSGQEQHGTLRQRALEHLISSYWLIDEAAAQGLAVSERNVERTLTERKEANGADEFQENLDTTGRTVPDVRLEIKAELAAAAIRRTLTRRAADITPPEIAAYYNGNRQRFRVPEQRVVDLIENLPSRLAATALVNRVGTGAPFTRMANHEVLELTRDLESEIPGKSSVLHAIFIAHAGVVSQPMTLKNHWAIFIVRTIIPATITPLADVQARIAKRLATHRVRLLRAEFTKEYARRWTTRTSCQSGYIVQLCKQYTGSKVPEGNPLSNM